MCYFSFIILCSFFLLHTFLFQGFLTKMKSNTMSKSKSDDGPFSIFGLKCGPICASDNVLDDETLSTLETRQSQKKSF